MDNITITVPQSWLENLLKSRLEYDSLISGGYISRENVDEAVEKYLKLLNSDKTKDEYIRTRINNLIKK